MLLFSGVLSQEDVGEGEVSDTQAEISLLKKTGEVCQNVIDL